MKTRSTQAELLDEENIPKEHLFLNLKELHTINKLLGGYQLSIKGLKQILEQKPNITHVLDIGFGGGDFLKAMATFARQSSLPITFTGVDLKAECVEYASENLKGFTEISLIESDYRDLRPDLLETVDVVHASLFLHHLSDTEIVNLLRFCRQHRCMVLVNDLQRHPLAMHSIRWLTKLLSKSYLVKNDAPLSVKKGFSLYELRQYFKQAGYSRVSIQWVWAFRFRVIAWE
jgi:2-polyprenyl-3-methyl-5-hydroxy-6-metoxy-1,4-benzoquinol methylase